MNCDGVDGAGRAGGGLLLVAFGCNEESAKKRGAVTWMQSRGRVYRQIQIQINRCTGWSVVYSVAMAVIILRTEKQDHWIRPHYGNTL